MVLACQAALAGDTHCPETLTGLGVYFAPKPYVAAPLLTFQDLQPRLPAPIDDAHPLWVKTYWKAWELAIQHVQQPAPGSGFVSQYFDAAFSDNVYLWDSSFMTLFCTVAEPLVPCISTLDNFYARQHPDGEICREMVRATGACLAFWVNSECKRLASRFGWSGERFIQQADRLASSYGGPRYAELDQWIAAQHSWDNPLLAWAQLQVYRGNVNPPHPQSMLTLEPPESLLVTYRGRAPPPARPVFTLEALNNPLLAWAELESYRQTGDTERLRRVWPPLVHYYEAFDTYLRQGNGLYVTDFTSMDNSARNPYLADGGTAIDTSAQMALFARSLSNIARVLGKKSQSKWYAHEATRISEEIERRMWSDRRHFYFDLMADGARAPVKTIAAYWPLVAHVASREHASALVAELGNIHTFGRPNAVPTLAADEPHYNPRGGYWNGSVWAPTTTMVIRGLEAYGYDDLARKLALQHVDLVASVFAQTGTIWETYSPEASAPGDPAHSDFVGWSGLGPILLFLESGIGLHADAPRNELTWHVASALASGHRLGCDRYRFAGHVVSVLAEPVSEDAHQLHVTVESDGDFVLRVIHQHVTKSVAIHRGKQDFALWGVED